MIASFKLSLFTQCFVQHLSFSYEYDPEQFAGTQIPLLVIGTKFDQAEGMRNQGKIRSSSVADEFGADQFYLVSRLSGNVCVETFYVVQSKVTQNSAMRTLIHMYIIEM